MTLDQIKAAVDAGLPVRWCNSGYVVHKDSLGQYLITYTPNGHTIGLTHRYGETLNGLEHEFFVVGEINQHQYQVARTLRAAIEHAGRCGLLSQLGPQFEDMRQFESALGVVIQKGDPKWKQ